MPPDPATLTTAIGEAVLKGVIGAAVKALISLVVESKKAGKLDESVVRQEPIEKHIREVANWCSSYNFLGVGKPKSVDLQSIELSLSSMPRRLRGAGRANTVKEDDLFSKGEGFVLLGDPGSGKTTTLKRVAQRLLTEGPKCDSDDTAFPLLVVLRELPKDSSSQEVLAEILGVTAVKKVEDVVEEKSIGGGKVTSQKISRTVLKVGDVALMDFLAMYLTRSKALLLIDGLDEVSDEQYSDISRTIAELCRKIERPRIIVTCRSGAYRQNIERLSVCELLPLTPQQVREISQFWIGKPGDFLAALKKLPYRDIADRPLLLTYLLFLYSAEKALPEQPSSIYRKVVYRLLREWDEERQISRRSKYGRFDVDRKIDFLSELSYQLTYISRSNVFSESALIGVYRKIHRSYRLPGTQYRAVVREIETHTGILVESGPGRYEFSHLSLQEFFCGNYLSRAPYPELMKQYLESYTPPVAVACAMSADPSLFLIELVENRKTHGFFNQDSIGYFLARLRLENPVLRATSRLGFAVMLIFGMFYSSGRAAIDKEIEGLLELYDVRAAVRLALLDEGQPIATVQSGDVVIFNVRSSRFAVSMLFDELPIKLPLKFFRSLRIPTVTKNSDPESR